MDDSEAEPGASALGGEDAVLSFLGPPYSGPLGSGARQMVREHLQVFSPPQRRGPPPWPPLNVACSFPFISNLPPSNAVPPDLPPLPHASLSPDDRHTSPFCRGSSRELSRISGTGAVGTLSPLVPLLPLTSRWFRTSRVVCVPGERLVSLASR